MAKLKLELDEDFDFDLIGICSSFTDYRLCWGINKTLSINLERIEDYSMQNKKDGKFFFSFYEYFNESTEENFFLIKNQSYNFKKLITEQDKIDYFLIIKNNYEIEIDNLLMKLKALDSVLTAFSFDVEALKSKSNLIF